MLFQLQVLGGQASITKHPRSRTQQQREYQQVILIDEPRFLQSPHQRGTSVDQQRAIKVTVKVCATLTRLKGFHLIE